MKKYLPSTYILLGIILTIFLIVLCRTLELDWYQTFKMIGIVAVSTLGVILLAVGLTEYDNYRNN